MTGTVAELPLSALGAGFGAGCDRLRLAEAALDDARRKAARGLQARGIGFRQLDDFERARPVRQAANEAALLKRRDQPVNAGFRGEVECILHFVEGRRNAGLLHPFVNEQKQFLLLACEHRNEPQSRETNPERTLYVPYVFRKCLNFRKTWLGIVVFLHFIRLGCRKEALALSGYAAHITVANFGRICR
jgi:hypothetical protein